PITGVSTGGPGESGTLTVTAVSSNASIVKVNRITYTAPGTNGTVRLQKGNTPGATVIAVTVSDGAMTTTRKFTAYVETNGGVAPTISGIANQTVDENSSTALLPFTVGDAQTP